MVSVDLGDMIMRGARDVTCGPRVTAELRSLSRWGAGGGRDSGRSVPDVRPTWVRFALPAVLRRMLPRACAPHCQYSPPYSRGTIAHLPYHTHCSDHVLTNNHLTVRPFIESLKAFA